MGKPLYIPTEVKDAIAEHVTAAVERAREIYPLGAEDEDTLTGQLGGALYIRQQQVFVAKGEIPGKWKWSIKYYKFRGRGKAAGESIVGADGIFELRLDHGSRTETKSLLFQAKKQWATDPLLFTQAMKLSTWREAAIVLNYTPESFEAYHLDDVIGSRGNKTANTVAQPLAKLLGHDFPDCNVGETELFYDAIAKKLVWKDYRGDIVATQFLVKHRIDINVVAPRPKTRMNADREIPSTQIHLHRMAVTNEDLLSTADLGSEKEIKKAHKKLVQTYHPDKLNAYDQLIRDISTRRVQEINDAKNALLSERKRRKV
jgi:hypothetical protein